MKQFACLILALAALTVAPPSLSIADDKPAATEKRNVWMKQKLKMSQEMLAGLTEGDFDKIIANAAAMNVSGYLEKWIARGQPRHEEYELQRGNFEFYNRELIRQSRDKNIDGATLAYNLMTASCVQCHKIVRDVKK
jgi:cytochrome c556